MAFAVERNQADRTFAITGLTYAQLTLLSVMFDGIGGAVEEQADAMSETEFTDEHADAVEFCKELQRAVRLALHT